MRVQTLTPLQPEYPCLPLPGFQFSLLKTNTSYFKIQKSLMWLDPLTGTGTLLYHAFRNCSHDRSVQPRSVGDTTGPAPGSQLTNREGLCKHSPCMGGGGAGALVFPAVSSHGPQPRSTFLRTFSGSHSVARFSVPESSCVSGSLLKCTLLGPAPRGSERLHFGEPRAVHCFKASQGVLRVQVRRPVLQTADRGLSALPLPGKSQDQPSIRLGGLESHVF